MARVCGNQEGTVQYVRSSNKNWPGTLNGKGERAVTRILESILWPEIHSQPGREGTKIRITLIILSFCLMFSLRAPPTGWTVWKPGTRVPVNAFQESHHLPGTMVRRRVSKEWIWKDSRGYPAQTVGTADKLQTLDSDSLHTISYPHHWNSISLELSGIDILIW